MFLDVVVLACSVICVLVAEWLLAERLLPSAQQTIANSAAEDGELRFELVQAPLRNLASIPRLLHYSLLCNSNDTGSKGLTSPFPRPFI